MTEQENNSVTGAAARVIPRIYREPGGARTPIDQSVADVLASHTSGLVVITAKSGYGKSTACAYVRAAIPSCDCFDDDAQLALHAAQHTVAVLFSAEVPSDCEPIAHFELCAWNDDDCMEYLLRVHRAQCQHALQRLTADSWRTRLAGCPLLLTHVLDRLAANPQLSDAQETLRHTAWMLVPENCSEDMMDFCMWSLRLEETATRGASPKPNLPDAVPQPRLWEHKAMLRVFAAAWIADKLNKDEVPPIFYRMFGAMLIPEIADAIRQQPDAIAALNRLVRDDPRNARVPMAVSVLLRVEPSWRPPPGARLDLRRALLHSAQWSNVDLRGCQLKHTDFTQANLSNADLQNIIASEAIFSSANLRAAKLNGASFIKSQLIDADLTGAHAARAIFTQADLTGANLAGANLSHATLDRADLTNANCTRADFCFAFMPEVIVDGCDFQDAKLEHARMRHIRMSLANWMHASFRMACVIECNLEGLALPTADFSYADLSGSLLTATFIPGGKFKSAILRNTGLAEIDWENADLTDADFKHATFHLGSSRSGRVGSTIAGEGSKTGFYSDEYQEQDFKAPEEIRKASLCGALLVGAKVWDTDFYLVDLRKARYTDDQAVWFSHCGAILVSRVA